MTRTRVERFAVWTSTLPQRPEAVPLVRRRAQQHLRDVGLGALTDRIGVVISELAMNAVLHGSEPRSVSLVMCGDHVRIEARDGGGALPVLREIEPSRTGGNGMLIIESLARAWGVDQRPHGKVVWAEVPLDERADVAHDRPMANAGGNGASDSEDDDGR